MNPIVAAVTALVSPVTKVFTAREKRKQAKQEIEGNIALAKNNNQTTITVGVQAWEALTAKGLSSSLKDEWAVLVGTSPLYMTMIGAVLFAFGYTKALEGVQLGLALLTDMGIPLGPMVMMTLAAALGIRWSK